MAGAPMPYPYKDYKDLAERLAENQAGINNDLRKALGLPRKRPDTDAAMNAAIARAKKDAGVD